MTTIVASAPGKLILVGEHAAVYGHPAITTAIGLRATASFEAATGDTLAVELPDLEVSFETDAESLRIYAAAAQRAWRRSTVDPTSESLAPASAGDESHLARIACGEVVAALAARSLDDSAARARLPGGRLIVRSEIPVGAGFGSSAATAMTVIGALLTAAGLEPTQATVEPIALEVERRQHGTPSGIDHNTVLRGGTLLMRAGPGGARTYSRLDVGNRALSTLRVFDTGTPADSTGHVVSSVKRRRRENPIEIDALLERMGRIVERLAQSLPTGDADLRAVFRDYERCLEELGVVPRAVREAVRTVERQGGGAKISGAGSRRGETAGCLLVAAPVDAAIGLERYRELTVATGVPGLRVEVR